MDIESPQNRDVASPLLFVTSWVLFVAQVGVAGYSIFFMFMSGLSVASCTETSCDYAAFDTFLNIFYVGALGLLIAAAVFLVRLGDRPRLAVWVPVLGIVLTVVLLLLTYSWSRAALDLPLFGGRGSG